MFLNRIDVNGLFFCPAENEWLNKESRMDNEAV